MENTLHALNINTKVHFMLEHNISSTNKTHSDASWMPICWEVLCAVVSLSVSWVANIVSSRKSDFSL